MRRRHINLKGLSRVIGWLLMIEGGFMCFPLIISLVYHESDAMSFVLTALLTAGTGFTLYWFNREHCEELGKRDGFLLTALIWVVFSIFGMTPFIINEHPLSVSSAFFEAMSGFTTTGCTTMAEVENLSMGIHLWRCLMQWIGGMGIILFTLAVLPMLNSSAGVQMFNAEVTGVVHDKIHPRIGHTALNLWGIYSLLTLLMCVLLMCGPMNWFDGLCHALSTMSTGGFSTRNDSIGAWNSLYVKTVVTIFMFLGGINFALIYNLTKGRLRRVWSNETFRYYVTIIFVLLAIFIFTLATNGIFDGWESLTIDPLFQIVSTLSSTGYTVSNFETWGPFILSLVFVMMFFGACAGSTSGGAKIDRGIFLIKNCRNEIRRAIHPTRIYTVNINRRVIPTEIISKVIAFLCIYVLMIVAGALALTAMGVPLIDAFFSAFSCLSNTGLGAGVTGYGGSFDIIPDVGKWVLAMLMLTGRLELFTILMLFMPSFWRK